MTYTPPQSDVMLSVLVRMVDENPTSSMGLTLNVPGATVTGTLVAHGAWLQQLGAMGEGNANMFLRTFAKTFDELVTGDDYHLSDYVHLRGARFVSDSGAKVPSSGMLWRGRLSDVAAWALGEIGNQD